MQQVVEQLVVLVSASEEADRVRRDLTRRGIALASATASLARFRRSLVSGSMADPIVFCITLDEPTLRRHGRRVARLLEDRASFVSPLWAIGLRVGKNPPAGWASLGCDACAADASEFERLLRRFAVAHARSNRFRGLSREESIIAQRSKWLEGLGLEREVRKTALRDARTRAKWT